MTTNNTEHVRVLRAMRAEEVRRQSEFPDGNWWHEEIEALDAAISALEAEPKESA